ncbi:biotin--[acetyl-CoA-carboxylase] ligase [Pikeienuella sp. HZG-20]|uniref:biotin--[acetyl-CoA-carboxylase] ligase n=1 Tax=Paludibacillus litoralis TaxID=3133267 RepID=UPI0030EE1DFA
MSVEPPVDWPRGLGLIYLDEVDSTNEEARRRAAAGEAGPLWIAARRQVAGRGRWGRVWLEAEGNLYATLLSRPEIRTAEAGLLSFAACLAIAEFFEGAGGAVALKWPNDALLNGGKAAGVLLEGSGRGDYLDWLAIGVGVNLVSAPSAESAGGAHPPTSLLASTGKRIAPEVALREIATSLDRWSKRLTSEGFAPLRAAWLSRATRLGERIEARTPKETIPGVFEDVDEKGALVLRTSDGVRRIHAADIYFT